MYRFYMAALDVVPAAVVLIPVFGVLYGCTHCMGLRKSIMYCLFCLYISAVLSLVGIPNVKYIRLELNLYLIPFAGMIEDLKNSVLNVILFIPLGVFLPLLWQKYQKFMSGIIFAFCFSLMIELLQMLTFRTTDVNDLITNTAGYMVGYLLVKPLLHERSDAQINCKDVYVLCILTFGIMFFVHPFLSPLIWDSIL